MGADMKSLRTRIRSVDSTLHLTTAMGLVASSKIRKAAEAMNKGRAYEKAVTEMIGMLTACPECKRSPYMRESDGKRTKIIVIAGDRGLCGGYNGNIFRMLREYPDAELIPIGKRPADHYGGEYYSSEKYERKDGYALADELCRQFAAGEYDRLGIACTKYISLMAQEAQIKWVLPLVRSEETRPGSTIFEPGETEILNSAVPEYVGGVIMSSVRESFACEVTARRMAMDNAGKNAQEMIERLQLDYNRARQGAITQEITEIVAGSGE